MKNTNQIAIVLIVVLAIFGAMSFINFMPKEPKEATGPRGISNTTIQPILDREDLETPFIQVALLLDSSGSMDGLLEQAKSQLWKMVNELATTRQNGKTPKIEIALYQYGRDQSQVNGYITQHAGLSSDLDKISELLFNMRIEGSNEYCGMVIGNSVADLQWSPDNDDLKIIIIAGNETFEQGPIDYRQACKQAISKGIMINTIYCGKESDGIELKWKAAADCADGKYIVIDQNEVVMHIESPYDNKLDSLNNKLNSTYLGYGREAEEKMENQAVQDANAKKYGNANSANRAKAKASSAYSNESWDMVDAAKKDEEIINKIATDDLPEAMKNMNSEEKKEYVKEMANKRELIKTEILELDKLRSAYIAEQKKSVAEKSTLDNAVSETLIKQAESKGFKVVNQ